MTPELRSWQKQHVLMSTFYFLRVTLNSVVIVLSPQPGISVRLSECGTSQGWAGRARAITEAFPDPCRCCPHGVNFMLFKRLGLVC